ncbi:MAG: cytochrome C [Chromatiales bacterium 21-64-14]|nr:MAG: cytochrome C [Chromatiales bacterium 21-64-14]HQU15591.1 cytochrome c [Gammaproteobacteria bacterium]
MTKRLLFGLMAVGLVWSLSPGAQAAGNPVAGKEKAFPCMGCHGIPTYDNAYPTYPVPKLGGQHAQYIVKALEEYKDGARSFKTMHAQASSLSKQDMEDLAAYFSTYPSGGK